MRAFFPFLPQADMDTNGRRMAKCPPIIMLKYCSVKRGFGSLMERYFSLPLVQAGIWVEGCFEPGTAMRLLVGVCAPMSLRRVPFFKFYILRWRSEFYSYCAESCLRQGWRRQFAFNYLTKRSHKAATVTPPIAPSISFFILSIDPILCRCES